MNYKSKREQLTTEFNQNLKLLQQLSQRNQHIVGQMQLIDELEKDEKPKKK